MWDWDLEKHSDSSFSVALSIVHRIMLAQIKGTYLSNAVLLNRLPKITAIPNIVTPKDAGCQKAPKAVAPNIDTNSALPRINKRRKFRMIRQELKNVSLSTLKPVFWCKS